MQEFLTMKGNPELVKNNLDPQSVFGQPDFGFTADLIYD